jgi:50S ribosomal subunit-associated GTPase HflX
MDLDCLHKPMIEVFNKIDLVAGGFNLASSPRRAFVSALTGDNCENLI